MKTYKPVKTIIEKWQLIIWIVSCLLGAGLFSLFPFAFSIIIFIGAIWFFASYYISRYLCRAETFFEYDNDMLIISRFCKTLDISDEFRINIEQIRGFEINEVTKGNRALILYFVDFKHLKLSLSKIDDEQIIEKFLRKQWNDINSKSNPNYKTFGSAYWFAFKRLLLFIATSTILCGILIWQHKTLHLSTFQTVISAIIISITVWIYTVNKPIKQNYFRFGAFYWFSNFMIYLSPLLLFPIYFLHIESEQVPLNLKNPYQLFNKAPVDLYKFDSVNYNPKSIISSEYFYGSQSGRGFKFTMHHYVATPLTNNQPITVDTFGHYEIWAVKHYSQSMKKRDDYSVKEALASAYQKTATEEFIQLFNKKPTFYKAMFNNNQAHRTVEKNPYSAKQNVVLEPHWESLEEYRNNLKNKIWWFIGGILLANLIGSLIIAYNR